MKVFISWSGERSRRVAELLHTWIQCVIQAVEPWVSSNDIDRGALWFSQIINELGSTTHGIICLTGDNKDKPWILFEAGALAKGLSSSRIYTLLVDLKPEDIKDPLAQFNHTRPLKNDMFKLLSSINSSLDGNRLKESILGSVFETYWPQFEASFAKILAETEVSAAPKAHRPPEDMLSEILNSVRAIDKRVRTIESSSHPFIDRNTISPGNLISLPKNVKIQDFHFNAPRRDPVLRDIWESIKEGMMDEEILQEVMTSYPKASREEILRAITDLRTGN